MTRKQLQCKKWKAGAAIDVDRVWAQAFSDWRRVNEEKARVIAAMIAAGERQRTREASK